MELNDTGKVRIILTIQGKAYYLDTLLTRDEWDTMTDAQKTKYMNEWVLASVSIRPQMPSSESDILKHKIRELELEVSRLKKQATPTFRYPPGVTIGHLPDQR
ncbi:hypothetical protein PP-LIT1_gp89 [Pseudomonas phage LIT1]|uniref:Uncharacterized protein n=1 Tax=Pseudomonas phage LIT1 TaxID=655098 RepID=C8ZKV3_9CAUD|nr:hypothetical protein PP-LIT1_gp89 [Pseudomonas phage LIT1]CAZ66345.1 hypothetical protein [Pseudomonas phage LIT1]